MGPGHIMEVTMKPRPMLAWPLKSMEDASFPSIVQPKLNGCRALWNPYSGHLLSRTGRRFYSTGHIEEAISNSPLAELVLDGELYIHGVPFQVISGMARQMSTNKHLEFHIFDYQSGEPFRTRWHTLLETIKGDVPPNVCLVPTSWADSKRALYTYLHTYMNQGFEGIIIRNPEAPYEAIRKRHLMQKFKPARYMVATLIGTVKTFQGRNKDTFGALQLQTPSGKTFSCAGLSDHERAYIHEHLDDVLGSKVLVAYDELSMEGLPLKPRFECLLTEEDERELAR